MLSLISLGTDGIVKQRTWAGHATQSALVLRHCHCSTLDSWTIECFYSYSV